MAKKDKDKKTATRKHAPGGAAPKACTCDLSHGPGSLTIEEILAQFEDQVPKLVEALHRLLENTPPPLADAALYIAWRTGRGEDAQTAWDDWVPSLRELFGPKDEQLPDEQPAPRKEEMN